MKAHGLVLAGGGAAGLLMVGHVEQDYDMFLVGHESDEAALAAITALGDHIFTASKSEDEQYFIKVYRSQGCVTFYTYPRFARAPLMVQVILRRYSTLAEVIHGFDLGASAVAWDGSRVYLTGLGKLAAECGANVLNLIARRASYETRLARYYDRGYDLVLPNLDVDMFRANEWRLPYLQAIGRLDGLTFEYMRATRPEWPSASPAKPAWEARREDRRAVADGRRLANDEHSDYAFSHISYGSERAICSRNIAALGAEPPRTASLIASDLYTIGLDVRTVDINLSVPQLIELISYALGVAPNDAPGVVRPIMLKKLLGADALPLVVEYFTNGKPPSAETIEQVCAKRIAELEARPHHIDFKFMGVEDKTALTGPFPRAVVSPADWYGAAYLPSGL